jgi:hypothetical protein
VRQMASGDRIIRAADERVGAIHRLEAAATEQARLRDRHEAAKGTTREQEASVLVIGADDQVAARERWLEWVEEHNY